MARIYFKIVKTLQQSKSWVLLTSRSVQLMNFILPIRSENFNIDKIF